ncbi:EPIDERMAL PATTERNING FACTOR-like protein 8 [Durio zibethinus]|uniref:Epidermal patterning factor-like protein n=1 Tax=Durio zibethinus TaxID=66656 RepID=A0A6P5XPD9_DURZI|nr:EPIDERMAL PATTERNING FACTOR-like protein 8 [Durio zibethinus]
MASFKHHPVELKIAVSVMVIFYLAFSPSRSVTANDSSKQETMVLGSRPPKCVNRCFSCRPCMAALVASPHHRNGRSSTYQGDESYYLLAWKCKCGDKFFQP